MEDILRPVYQERASNPDTKGVLLIEKNSPESSITDTFDYILLIITDSKDKQPVFIKHYAYENKKAALHMVTDEKLNEWRLLGSNKKIIDWIYHGKIVFDRNDYLASLKRELNEFPFYGRKVKKGIEFARLIRSYMEGKELFDQGNSLDAYNQIIHALHHLARLEIIEKGFHPEVTVWNQVKQIGPDIYKLYEELVFSEESLNQRLELLFLVSDFFIHTRTESGSGHILEIIGERGEEYWSFDELYGHQELCYYGEDLRILIEYLIDRGYIDVVLENTKGAKLFHRFYKIHKEI
ncbi:nucleotidyltransferase-like protein [Bacillus sp. D386]|uniref:nucleotidyltransferase-like protein n=1 Tax=Bacillus sp. D386 TaxID=2587155 RepID=UPI0011211F1F|nr:nucleotidyltransferase-like protein [Bacillus sp. D386]